jgi:hypothetical protein
LQSANPRRMLIEDRALALANRLADDGEPLRAAVLRESVPETFGNCDEHVPCIRAALTDLSSREEYADDCQKVLAAMDDLPTFLGRRGRVWVAREATTGYTAFWDEDDWLEQGPVEAPPEEVLFWAMRRSDDVRGPAKSD